MSDKKPEKPLTIFLDRSMHGDGATGPQPTSRTQRDYDWAVRSQQRRDQDRYLAKLARAVRGEDPFSPVGSRAAKQAAELHAENARLRLELESERAKRVEAEALLKKEKLNPASRTGCNRAMFAALVGGYGAQPDDDKAWASLPGQLVDDVARFGGSLDVKTARQYVRSARQQFKDDQQKG